MSNDQQSYLLSEEELFFLSQMMGIQKIVGFNDPYRGYLVSEIAEAYEKFRDRMVAKRYLVLEEESNEFIIDPLLGACIGACSSEQVLSLEKEVSGGGRSYLAFLYFTPHLAVELSYQDEEEISLSPVANTALTMNVVRYFFPQTVCSAEHFKIKWDGLSWEQWGLISMEEQIQALIQKGLSEKNAGQIARTFISGERKGSLRQLIDDGHWQSIHYASMGEHIYMACSSSEDSFSIETYNPEKFHLFLNRFESRMFVTSQ